MSSHLEDFSRKQLLDMLRARKVKVPPGGRKTMRELAEILAAANKADATPPPCVVSDQPYMRAMATDLGGSFKIDPNQVYAAIRKFYDENAVIIVPAYKSGHSFITGSVLNRLVVAKDGSTVPWVRMLVAGYESKVDFNASDPLYGGGGYVIPSGLLWSVLKRIADVSIPTIYLQVDGTVFQPTHPFVRTRKSKESSTEEIESERSASEKSGGSLDADADVEDVDDDSGSEESVDSSDGSNSE